MAERMIEANGVELCTEPFGDPADPPVLLVMGIGASMLWFGDPLRLAILVTLADGERRVTDLVSQLRGSRGNISGHLACLKDCGLVIDRAEGRQVFYRIAGPEVVRVLRSAESLLASTGYRIDLCSNYRTRG